MHFSRYAGKVTMVVRDSSLKNTVSQYLIDRIHFAKNVEVLYRTRVAALHGDNVLTAIALHNDEIGKEWCAQTSWLFLCLGGYPRTDWAQDVGIMRDQAGYLLTGPDLASNGHRPKNWPLERDPYHMETNMPGIFAAGDVRHGSVKRCASAVGEGAMAVMFVSTMPEFVRTCCGVWLHGPVPYALLHLAVTPRPRTPPPSRHRALRRSLRRPSRPR